MYCYLFNANIIWILLVVLLDYLVYPAGSCHLVNKLAWKPIHGGQFTSFVMHLDISCKPAQRACIFCGLVKATPPPDHPSSNDCQRHPWTLDLGKGRSGTILPGLIAFHCLWTADTRWHYIISCNEIWPGSVTSTPVNCRSVKSGHVICISMA